MTAELAIKLYKDHAGPKPASLVRRYLEWGGTTEDKSLAKYIKFLLEGGMAPGSVDLHRRMIQAFYRYHRMRCPSTPKGYRYDPKDARRPALSIEVIARFINAAKTGNLTGRQACLLALATTYGLRAGEMAAVSPQDVDPGGQRIYLRTLKGGRSRWCWLPPEISTWIEGPEPSSPNSAEKVFANIWNAIMESERPQETNWHAQRRALARDLTTAGVQDSAVIRFLRWASPGRGPERMLALYSSPSETVTEEGVETAREEDEGRREYDKEVWDHHPYVHLWR